nr:MAG TPA: hypothetical protein [Caudoviricetes sp.]
MLNFIKKLFDSPKEKCMMDDLDDEALINLVKIHLGAKKFSFVKGSKIYKISSSTVVFARTYKKYVDDEYDDKMYFTGDEVNILYKTNNGNYFNISANVRKGNVDLITTSVFTIEEARNYLISFKEYDKCEELFGKFEEA